VVAVHDATRVDFSVTFSAMMTEFTSPRLTMSPLRIEDAEEMFAVLDDPILHEFIGGQPAKPDELRVRYAALVTGSGSPAEEWLNWIVRRHIDGAAVGYVQATVHEERASIAWVIGTPWQRNGYATEAARAMVHWLAERNVTSIVAAIHPDHDASNGVAVNIGMLPTDEIDDGEVVWTTSEQWRAVTLQRKAEAERTVTVRWASTSADLGGATA
jgi:RimJ/RimL family protein N-acetyltransferase